MRRAIAAARASGSSQLQTFLLATLAEALSRMDEGEAALAVVTEALELAARTGERFYEAELHRLEGELRRGGHGADAETSAAARTPEACFTAALAIARRQSARALERRAAASLATLTTAFTPPA